MHICPTVALPLAIPLTNHETAPSAVPDTFGVIAIRWNAPTLADWGESVTLTLLLIVSEAETEFAPDVTAPATA
jgi:hypothetical protein